MIGVYILHTQAYMNADDPILHYVISPFYVNAFFVVSGYLFFRKWLNVDLGQGVMRKKTNRNEFESVLSTCYSNSCFCVNYVYTKTVLPF